MAYFAAPAANAVCGLRSLACPSASAATSMPLPFRRHCPCLLYPHPFSVDISNVPRAGKATNKYSDSLQRLPSNMCECVCALRTETASEFLCFLSVFWLVLRNERKKPQTKYEMQSVCRKAQKFFGFVCRSNTHGALHKDCNSPNAHYSLWLRSFDVCK